MVARNGHYKINVINKITYKYIGNVYNWIHYNEVGLDFLMFSFFRMAFWVVYV